MLPLPKSASQFEFAELDIAPAHHVEAPRVAGALAALDCQTILLITVGSSRLFVADVIYLAIDDRVFVHELLIDFSKLAVICRLARSQDVRTRDSFMLTDEMYFAAAQTS